MEITGKVEYPVIRGSVLDSQRINGSVILAMKGEKGDDGAVELFHDFEELSTTPYLIDFDVNEVFFVKLLNQVTFAPNPEFSHVAGVRKTFVFDVSDYVGQWVEGAPGSGWEVIGGSFDDAATNPQIVEMQYLGEADETARFTVNFINNQDDVAVYLNQLAETVGAIEDEIETIDKTVDQFMALYFANSLQFGRYYRLNDFVNLKSEVEPIFVFATGTNTFSYLAKSTVDPRNDIWINSVKSLKTGGYFTVFYGIGIEFTSAKVLTLTDSITEFEKREFSSFRLRATDSNDNSILLTDSNINELWEYDADNHTITLLGEYADNDFDFEAIYPEIGTLCLLQWNYFVSPYIEEIRRQSVQLVGTAQINWDTAVSLQFDTNEIRSDVILQSDTVVSLDTDFDGHIPNNIKRYYITNAGAYEVTFGTGFIVVSGTYDNSDGAVNVLEFHYFDNEKIFVTILSNVIQEDTNIKDTRVLAAVDVGSKVTEEEVSELPLWKGSTWPDVTNIATGNANEIPFVQEIEGVKSFGYSSGFKFVNGVLQLGDANNNLGIGSNVFEYLTTGVNNFAFGLGALQQLTTGESNHAIGYSTLSNLTTGFGNLAIGESVLGSNNGNYNCGIGNSVLSVNISSYNTAIGSKSLDNSYDGIGAVALGYLAGSFIADGETANLTNTNCLYLGRATKAKADAQTNEIVIGYDAIGNGSNSVTLGNDSILNTILKGNVGIGYTGYANSFSYPFQIKTTAANESATLGNELLSSSNWTSTGWTGDFATGFTHTAGNTTALTNTLAAVNGNLYQIAFTVTGRTAGSFTIAFGGQSNAGLSATGAWGAKASSTASLTITPTTDFDGKIVISIKWITAVSTPTQVFVDSAGNVSMEVRNSLSTLYNTFIGVGAGSYNTTGERNTFAGYRAGYYNTTGTGNTFSGYQAGYSNTTGSYNTFSGYQAGYSNTTGSYNTFSGYQAGYANTTGTGNTFAGMYAGYYNTTGTGNTFSGYLAGYSNTTGSYNTFAGYRAGYANTTGTGNTFSGYQAGYSNTTGTGNTFSGYLAGYSNTTGSYNTFSGYRAGYANTTGTGNTFAGMYAGYYNTTGTGNTFSGYQAGRYLADGSTANETPANSVYLGYDTRAAAAGGTNEIVIGYQAIGKGSNTARWGNTSITQHYFAGQLNLDALNTAPASAAATGTTGEIRFANDAIYVCIATNTWVKAALTTW